MVADSRAKSGTGRVRALNRPRPLQVEADAGGVPIAVRLSGRRREVQAVLETWRIDDEWWRPQSISRTYFSLLLEDGRTLMVYRDAGGWAAQDYWASAPARETDDRSLR